LWRGGFPTTTDDQISRLRLPLWTSIGKVEPSPWAWSHSRLLVNITGRFQPAPPFIIAFGCSSPSQTTRKSNLGHMATPQSVISGPIAQQSNEEFALANRRRGCTMKGFESVGSAYIKDFSQCIRPKILSTFNVQRSLTSARTHRAFRVILTWREVVAAALSGESMRRTRGKQNQKG
jgi:hypothetical protein